jgi:hypothetical protein
MSTASPANQPGLVEAFTVTTPGALVAAEGAAALPVKTFADLGRQHVESGTPVTYNSNPPTSGPHYSRWAPWGIYTEAPPDEWMVHNLEHGGIVASYQPEMLSAADLEKLRAQVKQLSHINPRIVLVPRPTLEVPLAIAAWGHLLELDRYDPATVELFYNAYIARGPECREGRCPG